MTAEILDGRALGASIRHALTSEVEALDEVGAHPALASLQVGASEASRAYMKGQRRACADVGILYTRISLDEASPEEHVLAHIRGICKNPVVSGLIIQLPVPAGIDIHKCYRAIDPEKDVIKARNDLGEVEIRPGHTVRLNKKIE